MNTRLLTAVLVSLSFIIAFPAVAEEETKTETAAEPTEAVTEDTEQPEEESLFIARRKSQISTTPGYIVIPVPLNIPGLGFSYGFIGSWFNIKESEMDFMLYNLWGDLAGFGTGLLDIPLGWEPLSLTLFYADFKRVGYTAYQRGMDSDPDETTILELDDWGHQYAQVSAQFFERRFKLYAGITGMKQRLKSLRTSDGDTITEFGGRTMYSKSTIAGTMIDITDDKADPRKGVQFEFARMEGIATDDFSSDQYTLDYNLIGYIPIGKQSTWAFNAYRSDAIVTDPGVIDRETIKTELAFGCEHATDAAMQQECEEKETERIDQTEAHNRHGTAPGIGGTQRLRSFSTGRFYDAHSLLFGTEFRWNLTEEFTAFDYFVAKGVRTGIQIAFFAERGGVSELAKDLGKDMKTSYGVGFRLIVASGIVARLDLAHGDEGFAPNMVFQYPWMLF